MYPFTFQALVSDKVKKAHREKMRTLKDPTMVIDMYYCGTLERPHRIKEILKNGFSEEGRTTVCLTLCAKVQYDICKEKRIRSA